MAVWRPLTRGPVAGLDRHLSSSLAGPKLANFGVWLTGPAAACGGSGHPAAARSRSAPARLARESAALCGLTDSAAARRLGGLAARAGRRHLAATQQRDEPTGGKNSYLNELSPNFINTFFDLCPGGPAPLSAPAVKCIRAGAMFSYANIRHGPRPAGVSPAQRLAAGRVLFARLPPFHLMIRSSGGARAKRTRPPLPIIIIAPGRGSPWADNISRLTRSFVATAARKQ